MWKACHTHTGQTVSKPNANSSQIVPFSGAGICCCECDHSLLAFFVFICDCSCRPGSCIGLPFVQRFYDRPCSNTLCGSMHFKACCVKRCRKFKPCMQCLNCWCAGHIWYFCCSLWFRVCNAMILCRWACCAQLPSTWLCYMRAFLGHYRTSWSRYFYWMSTWLEMLTHPSWYLIPVIWQMQFKWIYIRIIVTTSFKQHMNTFWNHNHSVLNSVVSQLRTYCQAPSQKSKHDWNTKAFLQGLEGFVCFPVAIQRFIHVQLSRTFLSDIFGSAGKRVVEWPDCIYRPDVRTRSTYQVQGSHHFRWGSCSSLCANRFFLFWRCLLELFEIMG